MSIFSLTRATDTNRSKPLERRKFTEDVCAVLSFNSFEIIVLNASGGSGADPSTTMSGSNFALDFMRPLKFG